MSEGPIDHSDEDQNIRLADLRRRFKTLNVAFQALQDRKGSLSVLGHAKKLIALNSRLLDLQREWRRAGFSDDLISD
jgi:hypothetical protein